MIRALWFMIKAALFIAAVLWIAEHPGTVEIIWLDYTITIHIGLFLLLILAAILLTLFLYNTIRTFVDFPASYSRYQEVKRQEKGYRALTLGLTAVAAGDTKSAAYQAYRTTKLMKNDTGLPLLLEAQAARLEGREEDAQKSFTALLENKDAAFLGIRGLLQTALDHHDDIKALELAQKGLKLHPKQTWLLHIVYDLQIRLRHWADAETLLKSMEKSGIFTAEKAAKTRTAILLAQAEEAAQTGNNDKALKLIKRAQAGTPDFIPAILALANHYQKNGKRRKAVTILEKIWKQAPHPAILPLWDLLTPTKSKAPNVRLHWYEHLLSLKSDSAESLLAVGDAALREGLWGEALTYFKKAEKIKPSKQLYEALANLERQTSHDENAVHAWLEKAQLAPIEPCWICSQTGQTYESWSPIAQPHGSFNTIIWATPQHINEQRIRLPHPSDENMAEAVIEAPRIQKG